MNVPSSLRTGFGLTDIGTTVDLERLTNILSYFTEKAITIGVEYAHSAGRDTLTSTDIQYALQYQAKHFLENIQNEEDLEAKLNGYSEETEAEAETESEAETDTESEAETETESEAETESEEEEEFTRAEGSSDPVICEMNRCHDEWDAWIPTNTIEMIIKSAVDQTLT